MVLKRLLILTILIMTGCTTPTERNTVQTIPTFTEHTALLDDNPPRRRYGVAVLDALNTGREQYFVTGYDGANQLLAYQNGTIDDVTPDELKDPHDQAIGAAACDITGDGTEELYILTTDTYSGKKQYTDHLYSNDNGTWTDLLASNDVNNRYAGRSVACLYTPHGYAFYVARYGGPSQLIAYDDGLTDIAPAYGMNRTTGGRSAIAIPTPDGIDLFAGNERGPNYYYERNSDGYEERARELGVADPYQNARGVAILDVNDDNQFDIALGNWNGPHRLYQRNDTFNDIAPSTYRTPTPVRTVIAADFDNNQDEELFINNIDAPNSYHTATGTDLPIGPLKEPNGFGTGAAVADINDDGVLELLVSHGEQGRQALTLYAYPTQRSAIRVQPVWPTGAPARNARVTFTRGARSYVTAIDGGSGYLNQMEPWAHVGTETSMNVTIRFPDGARTTQELRPGSHVIPHPNE